MTTALYVEWDGTTTAAAAEVVGRAFAVEFDGDTTGAYVDVPDVGGAVEITGGPPGPRGLQGFNSFETWKQVTEQPDATFEEYVEAIRGLQGIPGPSGYLVYDEVNDEYPERPIPGVPVAFAGPVNPNDLGVMIDGDVWLNTSNDPTDPIFVEVDDLDADTAALVEDTGADLHAAVRDLADARFTLGIEAYPGLPKDRIYVKDPAATVLSIDEFETDSMASYTKVDGSNPAKEEWSIGAGGLTGVNAGGDTSAHIHCLLRPGTLEIGEYLETYVALMAVGGGQSPMCGIVCANAITPAGVQVMSAIWSSNTAYAQVNVRQHTNMTSSGSDGSVVAPNNSVNWSPAAFGGIYMRLRRSATVTNGWEMMVSNDGINWLLTHRLTNTLVPTHYGFFHSSWASATPSMARFSYLRKSQVI